MIPSGEYYGRTLGWARPFNLIWSGKCFYENKVTNRILGMWMIEGETFQYGNRIIILYNQLGLHDELTYRDDKWFGSMILLGFTIRFTLAKTGNK